MKKDNPEASEESSITEEDEEIEDDEVHDSKMTDIDDNGVKKLKKLKPSGIVFFAHIDPDASSEEEVDAKNKKKDVTKKESIIDLEEAKKRKKASEEAAARKKDRDKKLKDINKNFARKDKRETHRFL